MQVAMIAGPALGGVAIATIDLGPTYSLNGIAYLAGVVALLGIRTPTAPPATSETPWRSLVEGLRFVRQKPVIVSLLVLDLCETVLGSYRGLLPVIAALLDVGPGGYGLLSAAPGVGSLLGAVFILSLGDMRYKGLYTVFGVLAYCVALVVLALSPAFLLSLVAASLLGVTNSVQMIPRNSAILAISPDSLRGRVEAFRSTLAGGGPPLGYTTSGALATVIGAPAALVAGALTCAALVVTVAVTRRELWDPNLGSVSPEPSSIASPAAKPRAGSHAE
jgi:MFS family permease